MDELKCSVCGSPINAGDSFCQNCGNPVQTEPKAEEKIQPEAVEKTGTPFSLTEKDTQPDISNQETPQPQQAGTYNQETPQPQQTGTYNQGMPQPQQTGTYYQGIPQPQQTGTYYQNTYYGQQPINVQPTGKQKKPGKAAGVVGLIFAILGFLTAFCGWAVIPVIFSIVGIILAIVSLVKGNKGLGISSLIVGGLGFILGVIMLIFVWALLFEAGVRLSDLDWDEINDAIEEITNEDTLEYTPGDYDAVYDSDYTYDDFGWENSEADFFNQIEIDGIVYTLPIDYANSGITVNDRDLDDLSTISTDGWEAGEYDFVLLDLGSGSTVWGFLENTTDSTVYSVDELQITGINVDNYSDSCTVTTAQILNEITLGSTREDIEEKFGEPDSETSDGVYYDSADGNSALYLEYDSEDKVQCLEVTVYQD